MSARTPRSGGKATAPASDDKNTQDEASPEVQAAQAVTSEDHDTAPNLPSGKGSTDKADRTADREARKQVQETEKAARKEVEAERKDANKRDDAENVQDTSAPEGDAPTTDQQDPKVVEAGGEPQAVAPNESPIDAAGFNEEITAARKKDAEASPVDFHHEEQNADQLPSKDQLTGTGEPNRDVEDDEALRVESAGELKNSGEAAPSATDTAVVTSANQQQKAVGALAAEKAPADQDKTAIAESPVSTPNGERVVTFTTPPRVALADTIGDDPAQGDTEDIDTVRGFNVRQNDGGLATNGVSAGLETVDSGIIPDATVAETDGTYMPAGAPNETYDATQAPDSLYTGAELNAAPLLAPQAKQYTGDGEGPAARQGAVGLTLGGAPGRGTIFEEGKPDDKVDLSGLFVPLFESGSVMVCTKRLIERGEFSDFVLLPVGAQVSQQQAATIEARISAS